MFGWGQVIFCDHFLDDCRQKNLGRKPALPSVPSLRRGAAPSPDFPFSYPCFYPYPWAPRCGSTPHPSAGAPSLPPTRRAGAARPHWAAAATADAAPSGEGNSGAPRAPAPAGNRAQPRPRPTGTGRDGTGPRRHRPPPPRACARPGSGV